mgnify:CR=1 FL=1
MKCLFYLSVLLASLTASAQSSSPWMSDQGDGTYMNPIIHADYSDPDICRTDNDYWMTASSFNCIPGLPILHSTDLVNWRIVNHAIHQLQPTSFYDIPQHGKGIWAPSIRFHDGNYYIYWGDPDFGVYMVKTSDPSGQWENPVEVWKGKGIIDTTPLWDDDGKVYLVNAWAGSRAGMNSILTISEMNEEGTKMITQPVMVYDGAREGNHTVEGPKLYKRNGYYYILAPAGGVQQGWQIALRSRNIYGPYESQKVMIQGNSPINGPHQGGLVDAPDGSSWFVHFQDKGLYGRVLHLNPVTWKSDWPVMGRADGNSLCGEPITRHKKPQGKSQLPQAPQDSDEFNSTSLGLQWQWNANYQPAFGFPTSEGTFRLYSSPLNQTLWNTGNLLLQKFPAEAFTMTTKVTVCSNQDHQESGIVVMGRDYCRLGLMSQGDKYILRQTFCQDAESNGTEQSHVMKELISAKKYNAGALDNKEQVIYFRIEVAAGGLCQFSYSLDDKKYEYTGMTFQAREGKWIGAKLGYFSVMGETAQKGWMDIDWCRFSEQSVGGQYSKMALSTTRPLPARFNPDDELYYCNRKVEQTLRELKSADGSIDYTMMPRNISLDKKRWKTNKNTPDEWCAGFWPGVLWYDYENTRDAEILQQARSFTESLEYLSQRPVFDHDLGFIMICSYENGYRLTGDSRYRDVLLASADSLATLYNPQVGTLLSWPRNVKMFGGHNTIMDNMINLELLFWAAENGGDHRLHDIAVHHAETTMRNHFRPDYTSFHVAVYDSLSGHLLRQCTHQGYSDESMWARGQSWAIYGYTMVYRWTHDRRFLDFAQKVTDVYLDRLPSDGIPYWDFNDPKIPNCPKDASTACIVASALLELEGYVTDADKAKRYHEMAVKMLKTLSSSKYQSGDRNSAFLLHSVGNMPAGTEIDASIIYADYYYIEALNRLKKQRKRE